jgi:tetratricopeptide (TPR) repeat protein
MICFWCQCGRQLQAGEDMIGEPASCPLCRRITIVPSSDQPRTPDFPPVPPKARINEYGEIKRSALEPTPVPREPTYPDRPRPRRPEPTPRPTRASWNKGGVIFLVISAITFGVVILVFALAARDGRDAGRDGRDGVVNSFPGDRPVPDAGQTQAAKRAAWNHQQGREAFDRKDYDLAVSFFTESLKLSPGDPKVLAARCTANACASRLQEASEDAADLVRIAPDQRSLARAYTLRAYVIHLCRKEYQAAITQATEAIRLAPDLADPYQIRGEAYYHEKRLDEALADLNNAIRLGQGGTEVYRLRGWVYFARKNYDMAIQDFTRAIEDRPDSDPLRGRASCYYLTKRYKEAIADGKQAVRMDPKDWFAHTVLVGAYREVGDNRASLYHLQQLKALDATR